MKEPSSDTLAQFLLNNEGERCVVVLDVCSHQSRPATLTHFPAQEIEKVEDPKALYSLLMPWELGESIQFVRDPYCNFLRKAVVPLKLESDMSMSEM